MDCHAKHAEAAALAQGRRCEAVCASIELQQMPESKSARPPALQHLSMCLQCHLPLTSEVTLPSRSWNVQDACHSPSFATLAAGRHTCPATSARQRKGGGSLQLSRGCREHAGSLLSLLSPSLFFLLASQDDSPSSRMAARFVKVKHLKLTWAVDRLGPSAGMAPFTRSPRCGAH